MPRPAGCAKSRVTESALVWRGPCVVYGAVTLGNAIGATVTLYDSQSADAGRTAITIKCQQQHSRPVSFGPGAQFDSGLYVEIGANVLEAVVFYDPLYEAE